jgi:hypothetical protein
MTLITYRDGRPVGIQPVTLQTTGDFEVGEFVSLAPVPPLEDLTEPDIPPLMPTAG